MAEIDPSGDIAPPSEKPDAENKTKAAAKKSTPELKAFVDNGDGTVTDPNTGLVWKKADA